MLAKEQRYACERATQGELPLAVLACVAQARTSTKRCSVALARSCGGVRRGRRVHASTSCEALQYVLCFW